MPPSFFIYIVLYFCVLYFCIYLYLFISFCIPQRNKTRGTIAKSAATRIYYLYETNLRLLLCNPFVRHTYADVFHRFPFYRSHLYQLIIYHPSFFNYFCSKIFFRGLDRDAVELSYRIILLDMWLMNRLPADGFSPVLVLY